MHALDEGLLRLTRSRAHTPGRDQAVAQFSALGEHAAIWLAFGAGAAVFAPASERRDWRRATACVAGAYVLNTVLKIAVGRPRPELADLPALVATPTRLSFPSAHATSSFAAARAYSSLGVPRLPLYAMASGLAASRLYLGLHYPSDVLAGAALGAAIGAHGAPRRP
jgi:decaprenylphosphoryl-5-phosphoribose phosphatase